MKPTLLLGALAVAVGGCNLATRIGAPLAPADVTDDAEGDGADDAAGVEDASAEDTGDGDPVDDARGGDSDDSIEDPFTPEEADGNSDNEADAGGTFGAPCATDGECGSGYCVLAGDDRVCTEFCTRGACADGWTCRALPGAGSEPVRLCVPDSDQLCSPCDSSLDCGGFGDSCVLAGELRFCARNCEATRECPSGYLCDPVSSVEGETSWQCLPSSGICSCPPDLYGESRDCVRANALGNCRGTQTCEASGGWSACSARLPEEELCDGLDNDCDGRVDEELPTRACVGTPNPLGACPGIERCEGARGWACDAPAAKAEICDGLDNDCDGIVDDGLCDDGNSCTRDICDAATGGCTFVPSSGPCDDGDVCTRSDLCFDGACTGTPIVCNDGNDCTSDSCDPFAGCRHVVANGAPCETGNLCTVDTCREGVCAPGLAVSCGSPNVCLAPSCDPAVGCITTRLSGGRCDDGDLCTAGDTCSNGTCIGSTPYCQGRPCSNCAGTWSFGGTCVEVSGAPVCTCICF